MSSAEELIRILEGYEEDVEEFVTDNELEEQETYNEHQFSLKWNNQTMASIDRIILAIRTYIESGILRVQEIKEIRWLQEESVPYEMGYIMGDIIERYKKIVEMVRRVHFNTEPGMWYHRNDVFHILLKLENVQKLYFEVYHLVRMLHEVPLKFEHDIVTRPPDLAALLFVQQMKEAKETVEKLKAKRVQKAKAIKKARRPDWTGTTLSSKEIASKPYNMWWPRDYGWELDAYGW